MIKMTEAKLQTFTFPPPHTHSGKRLRLTSSFVHFLCGRLNWDWIYLKGFEDRFSMFKQLLSSKYYFD